MEREFIYSIQKAIDYIEDNLKNDISNRQIAGAIGYSEFHFLRLFRKYVNLTPPTISDSLFLSAFFKLVIKTLAKQSVCG